MSPLTCIHDPFAQRWSCGDSTLRFSSCFNNGSVGLNWTILLLMCLVCVGHSSLTTLLIPTFDDRISSSIPSSSPSFSFSSTPFLAYFSLLNSSFSFIFSFLSHLTSTYLPAEFYLNEIQSIHLLLSPLLSALSLALSYFSLVKWG